MLTDIAIRSAKPGDKPIRMFGGGGLYLEVSPSGGKWWRLKYRIDGKEKRVSLGVYPDVTLKDARERRDEARKLLAKGTDPSDNRKAIKSARVDRAYHDRRADGKRSARRAECRGNAVGRATLWKKRQGFALRSARALATDRAVFPVPSPVVLQGRGLG